MGQRKIDEFELSDFQREQGAWAAATFGDQTCEEKLRHAIKEIHEVMAAPDDPTEYADVLSLILDAARLRDISADDIMQAAWRKLSYNRRRKWARNEDGTYSGSKPKGCLHCGVRHPPDGTCV